MKSARIEPATSPHPPEIAAMLERLTPPGTTTLALFRTVARDPRLWARFTCGGLLDRGHLTLREREIIIDRTTARCGSAYEWGVHVKIFGARAGFDAAQLHAIARQPATAVCWSDEDRLLIETADALQEQCDLDDALWERLQKRYYDEAILEILMLAGYYRMVSYLTNALRLEPEPFAAPFPGA